MSPTQAREIIEAASERIADWEARLRITTGDGIETWDMPNGQMVSVSAPGAAAPTTELIDYVPVLWAEISAVRDHQDLYLPTGDGETFKAADGFTVREYSGLVPLAGLAYLDSGEYAGQGDDSLAAFNNPNALVQNPVMPAGYSLPRYNNFSVKLAPFTYALEELKPPRYSISFGAGSQHFFVGETSGSPDYRGAYTTTVGMRISIRGYTLDYLDDRRTRGLPIEYARGENIGTYILVIRQDDSTAGPPYKIEGEFPGDEVYVSTGTSTPVSRYVRVGFQSTTLNFYSTTPPTPPPEFVTSFGEIGVVAYRKV